MTAADSEPTAIIAIKSSIYGAGTQLSRKRSEKDLEEYAARLGYTVLVIIDTDIIPDLWMMLTRWHPDAVIIPDESHIQLDEATRLCDVITLTPEAQYSGGRYELLSNMPLPKRIPGESGLAPHPDSAPSRAATTADWNRLVPALLGALRARDKADRTV